MCPSVSLSLSGKRWRVSKCFTFSFRQELACVQVFHFLFQARDGVCPSVSLSLCLSGSSWRVSKCFTFSLSFRQELACVVSCGMMYDLDGCQDLQAESVLWKNVFYLLIQYYRNSITNSNSGK